jgi:Family of unknown function (DUF6893)
MNEISIKPTTLLALLVVIIIAVLFMERPEIQRYLKVRKM